MEQGRSSESPRRKKSQRQHDLEFQALVLRSLVNIGLEGSIRGRVSDKILECQIMIEEEIAESRARQRSRDAIQEHWKDQRLDRF